MSTTRSPGPHALGWGPLKRLLCLLLWSPAGCGLGFHPRCASASAEAVPQDPCRLHLLPCPGPFPAGLGLQGLARPGWSPSRLLSVGGPNSSATFLLSFHGDYHPRSMWLALRFPAMTPGMYLPAHLGFSEVRQFSSHPPPTPHTQVRWSLLVASVGTHCLWSQGPTEPQSECPGQFCQRTLTWWPGPVLRLRRCPQSLTERRKCLCRWGCGWPLPPFFLTVSALSPPQAATGIVCARL